MALDQRSRPSLLILIVHTGQNPAFATGLVHALVLMLVLVLVLVSALILMLFAFSLFDILDPDLET